MTSFKAFRKTYRADQPLHFNSIPAKARSIQGLPAGFTSRFISVLIDMSLIAIFLLGAYGVWLGLTYVLSPFYDIPQLIGVPLLLVGYFLMWLYWTWSWATSGKSLGNVLMGLRVETTSGECPSIGRAASRALFSVVFPVGLAWAIISRNNKSVQDIVLRTRVIYDWKPLIPREEDSSRTENQ
jgi:uncharacterized RDD family membrane protein YckC